MANTVQIKYSDTAGVVPASLTAGELAINRADGKLFYANTAGVVQAVSLFNSSLKTLAANATNSAVTAVNTNLSFAIGANEIWVMEFALTVQCSGTGGSKFQVTAPTGATCEGWLQSTTTGLTVYTSQRITASNTLNATATHTVAAVPAPDTILVRVKNGATAGTVALGFASVTAAQVTTIFAGSFMRAYKAIEV